MREIDTRACRVRGIEDIRQIDARREPAASGHRPQERARHRRTAGGRAANDLRQRAAGKTAAEQRIECGNADRDPQRLGTRRRPMKESACEKEVAEDGRCEGDRHTIIFALSSPYLQPPGSAAP